MPKTIEKHTDLISYRILKTQAILLENDKYLKAKTTPELKERIMFEFGVKSRMAEKYIAEAKKEIKQLVKKDRDKKLNKALLDREWVIAKAKLYGDLKRALAAMKDRDELQELYTQNVKHSGEIDAKVIIVDDVKE